MPIIKRYSNRKLYDTEAKQYITLDGIAALIRAGEEVRVVDHATGEDLTALTLTQIVLEQAKRRAGFLPRGILTALIQAGGGTVNLLKRTLLTSAAFTRQVEEEIQRRIEALIEAGELPREEGLHLLDRLLEQRAKRPELAPFTEEELERALVERAVPTRADFQELAEQIDALIARLDEIEVTPRRAERSGS